MKIPFIPIEIGFVVEPEPPLEEDWAVQVYGLMTSIAANRGAALLAELYAAYMKETKLEPEDIALVRWVDKHGIVAYTFRNKEELGI